MGKGMRCPVALLCIAVISTCAGQAISAFNDSTSRWYVADTYPNGSLSNPGFRETKTMEYTINGDTTIAGLSWKTLEVYDHAAGTTTVMGHVQQDGSYGIFLPMGGTADTIYDYNLSVGDSVLLEPTWYFGTNLHVVRVDSLLIQGVQHKRIMFDTAVATLESYFTDVWVEGIGSVNGPLAPRLPWQLETDRNGFQDSTRLVCFDNSLGPGWVNANYPACVNNLLLGVDELLRAPGALKIYPNPASSWVRISWPPSMGLSTLYIYDARGRVVYKEEIAARESTRIADISSYLNGLYQIIAAGHDGQQMRAKLCKH